MKHTLLIVAALTLTGSTALLATETGDPVEDTIELEDSTENMSQYKIEDPKAYKGTNQPQYQHRNNINDSSSTGDSSDGANDGGGNGDGGNGGNGGGGNGGNGGGGNGGNGGGGNGGNGGGGNGGKN